MTIQQSISQPHRPGLRSYFLATRPMFLVASLLPVIFGTAIGYHSVTGQGGGLDILAFAMALVSVLLINLGINVLNDVYDDINGTDRINRHAIIPFTGGSRAIQDHVLTRDQMRHFSYLLLSLSVIAGFLLFVYKGQGVIWFGLLGLFLGAAYSVPPFKLASRGLGESAIFLGVGILPVTGAAWLQTGYFSWLSLFLAIPVGLWVSNIILVNEVPDAGADKTSGKRTLATRFGEKGTAGLYLIVNILASAILCASAIFGMIPFAALVLPVILLIPAVVATTKISLWNTEQNSFVNTIKFNIGSYIINVIWVMSWVLAS